MTKKASWPFHAGFFHSRTPSAGKKFDALPRQLRFAGSNELPTNKPVNRSSAMQKQPIEVPVIDAAISTALRNFDQLPDTAHVRQPVVKALFGCSDATVWRRVKDGGMPT